MRGSKLQMLSGHDIVCISTQDWDDLWTRKQRFMSRLAKQGNRVLYIEHQTHLVGYVRKFRSQWRRISKPLKGPRKMEDNLYIYTLPLILPFFQMSPLIGDINHWLIVPVLKKQILSLNFKAPILWIYAHYSDRLVRKLGERLVVCEIVDETSAIKGLVKSEVIQLLENRLISKSDALIVTAQSLLDSRKSLIKNIHLVPNGAEVEHFKKVMSEDTPVSEEIAPIKRPIIGFLGSISYWLDMSLIRHIALSHTEWSIVMIGPVRTDVSRIASLPNVHFLGRKDYQELPKYLKAFDVCMNPYILDGVAEGCSPLKLYEYLASGKPIVSVDMPEVRKFDGLVRIAKSAGEFVSHIESALQEDKSLVMERIKESEKHSWDERFRQVESIVEKTMFSEQR
jgi:glycosyltransferase involved in cell wall biosynthesis